MASRETSLSVEQISRILYPTGRNPKELGNQEACILLEKLDKIEPQWLQQWFYDATPEGMWVRSFRDLAYMGPHLGKPKHHRYSGK